MANGDDFDPYPAGTMTAFGGLSADDPLIDWGSNMKPSDLQQYVHDPEGFKQNMINQGIAPPDHHYTSTPQGLQAVDPQTGLPVTRGMRAGQSPFSPMGDPSQGNLTRPLAFAGTEAGDYEWTPGKDAGRPVDPNSPVARFNRFRNPNDPSNPQPPAPAPVPPPVPDANPAPIGGGPVPLPRPRPEIPNAEPAPQKKLKQAEEEKAKADKKIEAYSPEAMSDFAKSLQGVQVPKRPALPGVGTPAVRSPVGLQPGVQNLLALAGQGRPNPQQVALMRLLGRA
jgi:hypothetical protein